MKKVCYTKNKLSTCRKSWAGFGEEILHPITRNLSKHKKIAIKCYDGLESFVPHYPKEYKSMFHIYKEHFNKTDVNSCRSDKLDLICRGKKIKNFYNRMAYHVFNSINGKFYSSINVTNSNFVISDLYKKVLENSIKYK